jgi:UDP-2,3-diacylglucosamine pyrophosphatase LpxH
MARHTKRDMGSKPFSNRSPLPDWLKDGDESDDEPRSPDGKRARYRTIWISDIHLGTPGCNADLLIDFLKSIECETLYLVGDIIDMWRLRKGWYWPPRHNDVVRRILKLAKHGTHVVYVPGNHDEVLRDYLALSFGDVTIENQPIHLTADGRRLLVLHGDQFDGVLLYHKWLAFLGDSAYELLLKSNIALNWVRRRIGLPYWSLSAYMKKRVKNAVQFIWRYEEIVAHAAVEAGVDGIVCGHIHSAEIRQFGDVTYYNDGDWVESCTALVEHFDGRMEILDWAERKRLEALTTRAEPEAAAPRPAPTLVPVPVGA